MIHKTFLQFDAWGTKRMVWMAPEAQAPQSPPPAPLAAPEGREAQPTAPTAKPPSLPPEAPAAAAEDAGRQLTSGGVDKLAGIAGALRDLNVTLNTTGPGPAELYAEQKAQEQVVQAQAEQTAVLAEKAPAAGPPEQVSPQPPGATVTRQEAPEAPLAPAPDKKAVTAEARPVAAGQVEQQPQLTPEAEAAKAEFLRRIRHIMPSFDKTVDENKVMAVLGAVDLAATPEKQAQNIKALPEADKKIALKALAELKKYDEEQKIPKYLKKMGFGEMLITLVEKLTKLFTSFANKLSETFGGAVEQAEKIPFEKPPLALKENEKLKPGPYQRGSGVKIDAPANTPLMAVVEGTVEVKDGNLTITRSNGTKITYVGVTPKAGLKDVKAGDQIGTVPATAKAFNLQVKNEAGKESNPYNYLGDMAEPPAPEPAPTAPAVTAAETKPEAAQAAAGQPAAAPEAALSQAVPPPPVAAAPVSGKKT